MQELVLHLSKRRLAMMGIILIFALTSLIVNYNFNIEPASYFDGKYNTIILYSLILYKLIELPILYYILFYRHLLKVVKNINVDESFETIKKHTKLLFFLIPQGNIVFGVISFKVSGDVLYFLIFCFIALITLFVTKPHKLIQHNK